MGLEIKYSHLVGFLRNRMRRKIKIIIFLAFSPLLILLMVAKYNMLKIEPSPEEIEVLKDSFGGIKVESFDDILRISTLVISEIKHDFNPSFPINVTNIIQDNKGFCYDRSLILQKIFIYNNIPIRPVFLYYGDKLNEVSILNILDSNLNSHNIFEFKFNGNWFVMPTNNKIEKLLNLEEYISKGDIVPPNTKFIRYLNNRNGKFIYPSWIPDIY